MRTWISSIALCLALAAPLAAHDKKGAKGKPHTHAKTQKAHDHGAAEINIAVEGSKADIELHTPAMGIVGFEYMAKSAADKKKQADALAKVKASIGQIVVFDPSLGCKISAKDVQVVQEEEDHAEVDGDFQAVCAKPLAGAKVTFGLTKAFPALTSVKVQAVGTSGSTGAEIKNDRGTITLPR